MDPSFLRSRARGEAGESVDNMADILRAWDDTDDEMVEFVQESRGLIDTRPDDVDDLAFDEIDMDNCDGSLEGASRLAGRPRSRRAVQPVASSDAVRRYQTFFLFVAFFGIGIAVAMLGPTLLDLAVNISVSLQNMSYLFTARSIGYFTGSLVGGLLYDKCNSSLVLSISCLLSAVMMIIVPVGNNIYVLAVVFFFMGNFLGAVDTGGNALIIKIWEAKSRPYMQALHFAFAFGAFMSPLIVKPFLSVQSDAPNTTDYHVNATTGVLPLVSGAYWLGLLPLLVAGLAFLCCVCKTKYHIQEPTSQVSRPTQINKLGRMIIILFLFAAFLMLYVGVEIAYGGYLFTFGVKSSLQMSKDDAAYLLSGFWGSFALSRLAAVPLSRCVRPVKLLLLDIIGCFLGSALLASQFSNGCAFADTTKLWVGTILQGISMASVFPATMSWAEYYFEVSGRTASVLVCGATFGEMTVPLLVGNLIATVGPCVLMYTTFVIIILVFFIFIAIVIFGKYIRKHSASFQMHYQKKQQEHLVHGQEDEVLRLLKTSSTSLLNDTDI